MTKKRWVIADLHIGHAGVTKFLRDDGTPLRPWDTPDEMDKAIIERWNAVVGEFERVYVLGDVVINKRSLPTLTLLNGKKVLIAGNHDIFVAKSYLEYFDDVRGYKVIEGPDGPRAILSHIPIHEQCVPRYKVNIHGHLHSNVIKSHYNSAYVGNGITPDPRYICVSMEQVDFTPVDLDQLISNTSIDADIKM